MADEQAAIRIANDAFEAALHQALYGEYYVALYTGPPDAPELVSGGAYARASGPAEGDWPSVTVETRWGHRGDLEAEWVFDERKIGDGWLILDVRGGFVETCYDEAVGRRIVSDHNELLGLRRVSEAILDDRRRKAGEDRDG